MSVAMRRGWVPWVLTVSYRPWSPAIAEQHGLFVLPQSLRCELLPDVRAVFEHLQLVRSKSTTRSATCAPRSARLVERLMQSKGRTTAMRSREFYDCQP